MTKVLVLGAGGRIARRVIEMLAQQDVELTLLVRDAGRLEHAPQDARVVEGDVLDSDLLAATVRGQDIVYANLAGDLDTQARRIVETMEAEGVQRLIFITALGIYDEVPGAFGEWNRQQIGSMLKPYRAAADIIEASSLDYTILRPAWLTDDDEIDYEVTGRTEPFKGTEVSRKSVAALVGELVGAPDTRVRANLGVNKPGVAGDRPSFM
ncbi:SDR family oxidoreductase [Petropleomorpha daqingensis]|uniref:Uncharacterized protein YbjT (DUF2867 family) n=1 Tax=Petropleomorpha daqingensis TaxID=2026353 RepID=A0A853CML4_9ACTN|nr:SDR family oxidoreductase [Petropleomorpha daqingensis]NYJ08059.1 uncharacterized protein YbjT (DUF2867 family) [Petropleomorpha daqingensis]